MSNLQRVIMTLYFTFTLFFVVADFYYPEDTLVRLIKLITMITIFLAALSMKRKSREQKLMTVGMLFMILGDFFLGFGQRFQSIQSFNAPLGMLGFMISYLFLITAFQKNFIINKKSLLASVPIAVVFIPIFYNLSRFVEGSMFIAATVFGFVLCYMSWTAICTLFEGYYSKKAAWLIALSGYLIFISDMGVANALFNPFFKGQFVPWLEALIWITFVPAWALILAVVAEEKFTRETAQ